MLASLNDVNTHLPADKFQVTDGNSEITLFQIDVERVIKGYLSGVFSAATLALWVDPDSTPGYIRGCAGRLIAAFYYAKKTSEQNPDWDRTYPQRLYNEAMTMIEAVVEGDIVLEGVDEVSGNQFGSSFFYPDETATPAKFTMDMRW